MTRVYVAGPMSNLPALNFPAFHAAAASLRASGYEVISPVEINPDPNAKYSDCMRADLAQLVTCDAIALLPGWENSKGARVEKLVADICELNVIFLTGEWKESPTSTVANKKPQVGEASPTAAVGGC